ncbi:hypothetical protein SAMN04487897_1318 [Paenibacillus sp. yr247]|uniref:hypothetical protein n=1 Tax=Paenibacillus sp. yr247 TaxID=1761880 RepID=UPI000881746C|nr:hypothetical protein [Paenibacillus sp. yr247]SDP01850.1 hypothetical protein SAMN04487897_1318 [Paenibacillus sp. yr247]
MNVISKAADENEKNEVKSSDSFAAFVSLNRYFTLTESAKPSLKQAEVAVQFLCQMYGAKNEDELFQRGDSDLIATFNEVKAKIMADVSLEQ